MSKSELIKKIENKTAIVGVVGLGYVGLPFAYEAAKAGFKVIGIDLNVDRVNELNQGESYILDVPQEDLKDILANHAFEAVATYDRVPEMDVIVVAVPTPLDKNLIPDLCFVKSVSESVSKYLRAGQLVSLESTTYPGTTEEVMLPLLEKSGLTVEKDFFLAHSPERVDPGNKRFNTKNTNKVVGGYSVESLEVAKIFYANIIENIIPVSSLKIAELAKVFENTFRAVNIALVNEIMLLCDRMELNVWEVMDAAFSKPFGIMPFYPGPGIGGHCIPLDPFYLEWKAREFGFNTRFISLAGEINRKMPDFVREKTFRVLNQLGVVPSQSKVLILGVAYKKDIGDLRESPALAVIEALQEEKIKVVYHDPHVAEISENKFNMQSQPLTEKLLSESALVIITTGHSDINYEWVVQHAKHVLDTRNATKQVSQNRQKITLL